MMRVVCRTGGLVLLCACSDFFVQRREPEPDPVLRVTESWVQEPAAAVDVLWVIDNTPSMAEEQLAVEAAAGAFVGALESASLAWQIGVLNTELDSPEAGRLQGTPWIITARDTNPVESLAAASQVGLSGSGPAGGLGAVSLALDEPLRSTANRGFRRPDAALHVVVFSDGDDESELVLGQDPVSAFEQVLAREQDQTGESAQLSVVVGDPGAGCLGEGGQATPGDRYAAAADASGGAVGSICTADWAGVLEVLGEVSAVYPSRFPLQAIPAPGSERVTIDGTASDEWSLDLQSAELVFANPPQPDSVVRMTYVAAEARLDSGWSP